MSGSRESLGPHEVDGFVNKTLLADALDSSGHALLLADEAGRIIAANDAASHLLGYGRSELIGIDARSLAPTLTEHFRSLRRQNGVQRRLAWKRADGGVVARRSWLTRATVGGIGFVLILTEPTPASARESRGGNRRASSIPRFAR